MPAQRKQPQDHQAKAEAKRESVDFTFGGIDYSISRENADNLDLYEYIEEEKYILAIRGYLGPEQWAKFKDSHRGPAGHVSMETFEKFLDAAMAAIGGNSPASPTS